MPVNDPIGDMLTRIRNGLMARHETVLVPASGPKIAVAEVLKREGFIREYDLLRGATPQRVIRIWLAYSGTKDPMINGLRRISKPGLRVYVQKGEVPRVFGGLGIAVVSTSRGIMTGHQAWRQGIGGELLCYVW
ncbi:MAG: 30S ribosomal protein S8 [Chloroflexi bacterium]|nr:30S ribosomal protein S8 [Chloroflexota bacterium]